MAVAMSIVFSIPCYYLCAVKGSFFVFWLAWLISLCDGIGESSSTLFSKSDYMYVVHLPC